MAIKINGQDLQKRFINGQEIVRVYKNGGEIRPDTVPPTPQTEDLFYISGHGRLYITKNGNPTSVSLEWSKDKTTWQDINIRSGSRTGITYIYSGEKCYIRNKSSQPTGFSTSDNDYYVFNGDGLGGMYTPGGDINYLLCVNSSSALISDYCYYRLFTGIFCQNLEVKLPATTLTNYCYSYMFAITSPNEFLSLPNLPATTLTEGCYSHMFDTRRKIKLSETQTGEYQTPYRIPSVGTGTDALNSMTDMFTGTGGTFTGTPNINQTYYTSNTVI